jgi:hypothetical protein
MWLGDYQLGSYLPVLVQTKTAAGVPTTPDDSPFIKIYSAAGTVILSTQLPILDLEVQDGSFFQPVLLGSGYAEGWYMVRTSWLISGVLQAETWGFRIIPGGNADGAVVSAHWYQRPQANYVVQALASGTIVKGTNPRF